MWPTLSPVTNSDSEPQSSALVLHDVVKRFGTKVAVSGLSFRVAHGEVVALLGPNGAGKTTTIEMCEGFQKPTSGTISVLGIDPAKEPDTLRSRIGIMLQGGGSYSGIQVAEMLRLSASYHDNPLDPEWLIDVVGLRDQAKTTWRRLSGGQQQRLSLALAIIGRPELVFLDEPTAGMDAQSRLMVWQLVDNLRRDGVTIIVTTHLMDEAEALADRVIIIDQGHIVAEGTPAELTTQRSIGGSQISVVTDSPLDTAVIEEELHRHGFPSASILSSRPLTYQIHAQVSPELIALCSRCAAEQKVLIRELKAGHRSLEDVFLEITGREMRK
ncbi:ATP-binding cassette domain-containing protein [Corynebacterium poyangense]|uniref:ATP-binding cassette domain-containing protein n=1 Tax=Corynebacterium poyangense TaxID=2684405 RepID=A0A7H0SNZ1_9CORY|nr:ABC transporter ATP-binding protein [Corynebacterium poyangense]QNQ90266.1 ATP-binding cassette domain-containing protein [Corynebacterium poyangense]